MKCTNPSCNYESDNVCIDGLDEKECPNLTDYSNLELVSPDTLEGTDLPNEQRPVEQAKKFSFCGQTPLSINETQDRLKNHLGKVISLIGPVGVGKTTLISSIYDTFSNRNELMVTFGGSDTLFAFENLCHHARVTSRGSTVSTPRTSSTEGVLFYHLCIRDRQKNRQDFFFSDRSGESYSEMINDTSLGNTFQELARSDLLLFMADSSDLGNKEKRHNTRRKTIKLIESLFESKTLSEDTNCILILTKFDLVKGTACEDLCMKEADRIVQKAQQHLTKTIDILPLSARPNNEERNSPNCLNDLWQKLELLQFTKKRSELNKFTTNRSFHNLELAYDN